MLKYITAAGPPAVFIGGAGFSTYLRWRTVKQQRGSTSGGKVALNAEGWRLAAVQEGAIRKQENDLKNKATEFFLAS